MNGLIRGAGIGDSSRADCTTDLAVEKLSPDGGGWGVATGAETVHSGVGAEREIIRARPSRRSMFSQETDRRVAATTAS